MKYAVRLTAKAEQDVDDAVRWFAEQSAAAAGARWLERLLDGIKALETDPLRCPLAAESAEIGLEIRELSIGRRRQRYRLLFQVQGHAVVVLRVWHAARRSIARDEL